MATYLDFTWSLSWSCILTLCPWLDKDQYRRAMRNLLLHWPFSKTPNVEDLISSIARTVFEIIKSDPRNLEFSARKGFHSQRNAHASSFPGTRTLEPIMVLSFFFFRLGNADPSLRINDTNFNSCGKYTYLCFHCLQSWPSIFISLFT